MAADGYEDFIDFENIQWDRIGKLISAARNSNLNIRGFSVQDKKDKRIHKLSLWVNNSLRIRRVESKADFYETAFNTTKMTEIVNDTYIHYLD